MTVVERPFDMFRRKPEYDALISSLRATSKVPITEVNAKPPRPSDKAKIAAQMSLIERRLDQTGRAQGAVNDEGTAIGAHYYAPGRIDLSVRTSAPEYDNNGEQIPADARVFSVTALHAIVSGKFERNHAQRLPGLIKTRACYLDIGAGVGLTGAIFGNAFSRHAYHLAGRTLSFDRVAARIWETNSIGQMPDLRLVKRPCFTRMVGNTWQRGSSLSSRTPNPRFYMLMAAG